MTNPALELVSADDSAPIELPAPQPTRERCDRLTRLLCAKNYLFGVPASLATLRRMWSPPFHGHDPVRVGCDAELLLFHTFQSLLLSAAFLLPAAAVYALAPADSRRAMFFVLGLVVFKIAILNPWLSRCYFSPGSALNMRIPGLHGPAARLTALLMPSRQDDGIDAVYFRGQRPFVGYGLEINSWTIALDTSARTNAPLAALSDRQPQPLEADELYEAVEARVQELDIGEIEIGNACFIDGTAHAPESAKTSYHRPLAQLTFDDARHLDSQASRGRRYMSMGHADTRRDLTVTQMLRFSRLGKTIFCEFGSFVLSPGRRRYYRIDYLFGVHPLVFALIGPCILATAAFVATMVGPFAEGLLWLTPTAYVLQLWSLVQGDTFVSYLVGNLTGGWFAYRIVGVTLVLCAAFVLVKLLHYVGVLVGLALRIKRNRGRAWTYREWCAQGGRLPYFHLQEVVRFLKVQEKVLTSAIVRLCEHKGIDTSDFKENLTAFINQGVINSGEIRGNVSSKISSLVIRRRGQRTRTGAVLNAVKVQGK